MSREFLIESSQFGRVGKFVGCGGTFLDVWAPGGTFLGTCGTIEQAHCMLKPFGHPGESVKNDIQSSGQSLG